MHCQLYVFLWTALSTLDAFVAADADCSDSQVPTSPTLRLKRKLLCNYDPEVRPVKEHTNVTDVIYNVYIASIVYHDDIGSVDIRSWVNMGWRDEHLTWDKNEYSGLERLPVRCSRLWMPDVALTSGPTPTPSQTAGHCLVATDGRVRAGMPILHTAACVADITRWPFDTHNCTMRIGSWSYFGDQINLTYTRDAKSAYIRNRHWAVLSSDQYVRVRLRVGNLTWPNIVYSFVLQRHSGGYAATVFIPGTVLATITLATFWLEPGNPERLGLIRVNVICHCMYMIYLGMIVPGNGDNVPLIMTFFRDSFLLVGVSLLVSLCAGRMNAAARAPPVWISTITDGVLASRPGQFLLLGGLDPKDVAAAKESGESGDGDGVALVEASTTVHGWRLFAILLDRLCFMAFMLCLIILLSAFIPRKL